MSHFKTLTQGCLDTPGYKALRKCMLPFTDCNEIIGSHVEIRELNHQLCQHVYSLGYVKAFVLHESITGHLNGIPYFRFISKDQIKTGTQQCEGAGFQGYILRATDKDIENEDTQIWNSAFFVSHFIDKIEAIDLTVSSYKTTAKALNKIKLFNSFKIYLSLSDKNYVIHAFNRIRNDFEKTEKFRPLRYSLKPYDLKSSNFTNWIELENFQTHFYEQNSGQPSYSIIIPHYENKHFLCNSIRHLSQMHNSKDIEVIVIDDGSKEGTLEYIKYFVRKNCDQLNFKLFVWPHKMNLGTNLKIFRAGASRNWGAHVASSENLLFLDSDMLVPKTFLSILEKCYLLADITQFTRLHIPPKNSDENAEYEESLKQELYIEEKHYWSAFFESNNWMSLKDYWKFTCTYALAMKKNVFNKTGRIRRNYIQYGFEDTDLGYRLAQMGCRFHLEKTPLLHLTSSHQNTDSWYFKFQKARRIKPMAQVFYSLNQDPKIYESLGSLIL